MPQTAPLPMENSSILDATAVPPGVAVSPELDAMQRTANRLANSSISAALAAANTMQAGGANGHGPKNGGATLIDLARRDLDAALQLLAERAQYISDASGAAIALHRDQQKDMRCCASAGSNAPELGTLFSMESGMSGESVRTRLPLRCDDSEKDERVNREGCRQLGIASVAVMPILSDDRVLGVFELFSERKNAFGERDLVTLERLSQMVETAVKLAATAQLPEIEASKIEEAAIEVISDSELPASSLGTTELKIDAPPKIIEKAPVEPDLQSMAAVASAGAASDTKAPPEPSHVTPSRPLLWSAALGGQRTLENPAEPANVPASMRNLHQCQACGFPVSQGRTFCVECEEKSWRGQLGTRRPSTTRADVTKVAKPPEPMIPEKKEEQELKIQLPIEITPAPQSVNPQTSAPVQAEENPLALAARSLPISAPDFTFMTSAASSESWFSAHKYILGVIFLIAVVIAALVFTR